MMNRVAILYPIVLAALFALMTLWVSQSVEQTERKTEGNSRHDVDYTMHNFVTTQTDATGTLRYVLAATEMLHYPDDDSTILQRPRFTQFTTDKPYTQIQGLRAYVSSDGEEIEVVDNVKVVRPAYNGKGEMQVLTEKLVIFPNQDMAKTDSPVLITQAPKTVIHAKGMVFDKKSQTVQLFKRVKVHYERPTAPKRARNQLSNTTNTSKASKLSNTSLRSTRRVR